MQKRLIGLVLLAALLVGASGVSHAQNTPPTIIQFSCDLESITMAEAEAGTTDALFEWQTVGLDDTHTVTLSAYHLSAWVPVTDEGDILPASGSYGAAVAHPLNFGPPTYRLTVTGQSGVVLDQRVLTIPYHIMDSGAPTIENFSTAVQNLERSAVAAGTARVVVGWRVTDRAPYTNLVFEQVLAGGQAVPVELPRSALWVPSSGEGMVAPVLPGADNPVRLRLRVVNLVDGETLAEHSLPPIPVSGAAPTPVPTLAPAQTPQPPVSNLQIITFEVLPGSVERGGTVTVNWEVNGATQVSVWLLDTRGRLSQSVQDPPFTGSWTVTLSEEYANRANFMLFASDALGTSIQSSAIVQVQCPYTYFFGMAQGSECPAGDALRVQAAYQVYEHGFMLWRADTSDIFVLYDTGQVGRYRDTWQNEFFQLGDGAPAGLIHPQRGFGKVWMENPAVRDGLGWATAPEASYTMTYQRSADLSYGRLYMTLPSGAVIYLVENTWGLEVGE